MFIQSFWQHSQHGRICCFDDPESSAYLGEYTASSYDAVFYGNIASLFQYESCGCKKLAWLPMFSSPNDFPPIFEKDELLNFEREIDIVFIGEKNKYKEQRLSKLKSAFLLLYATVETVGIVLL